jgi:hypothetical protein
MFKISYVFILSICSVCILKAQGMHLLLSTVGEGAYSKFDNENEETLRSASFLPRDTTIFVRPGSGIETLVAGFQFRFGFETQFQVTKDFIELNKGSMLIQSRKLNNRIFIRNSKNEIRISGVGTCMVEITEDNSFKIVGVLGRLLLGLKNDVILTDLLAGDLIELGQNDQSFGTKVNINLTRVVETSFLISGFTNSKSFKSSIESMVMAQNHSASMETPLQIEVNEKVSSNGPTNKVVKIDLDDADEPTVKVIGNTTKPSYEVPSSDPLSELLGRQPTRSAPGLVKIEPKRSILKRLPGNLLRSRK